MAPQHYRDQSILILGAGCFGLAIAHSLASAGYSRITVVDKANSIPSPFSAANDLNKVIRAEYADAFYTGLSLKAIRKWQTDPLYAPFFHQTGFLNVTSAAASPDTRKTVEQYMQSLQTEAAFDGQVSRISGRAQIKKLVPAFQNLVGEWEGYYNRLAGYSHSGDALRAVYEGCLALNVNFYLGQQDGEVIELIFSAVSEGKTCLGARTRGGRMHLADVTIVALGADISSLIPEIRQQVTGRSWGVVHIQLTPQEAAELKGIPVTNVRDLAFFFEPDHATNKLKFCHLSGGYTNYTFSPHGSVSVPFRHLAESQFIPAEDELRIRKLLREVLPHLSSRAFIDSHLCWFADTLDSNFIIDFVPEMGSSMVVLSGDSGHGFKMLPIFGEFAKTLLEDGAQKEPKWRWKKSKPNAASTWRSGRCHDLADIPRARL